MLHHFSLIASSENIVPFYCKLGFTVKRRIDRAEDTVVLMYGHGVGLEIFLDPRHPKRPNPEPLGIRNISFIVDDLVAYAAEKNITIKFDWNNEKYVEIQDPDGNIIQLHE